MKEKTHISHVLEGNSNKDRYDAEVKKILGDKTILSWIMKYTMQEFASYTIEEVRECIEGTPEIATLKVRPGHAPEAVTGMPNEDKVPGEGEITYDIRFYAVTKDAEHIKIIINVEAQKSYYPGYDLVTRAIFYCARMLSAQLDTEFTPQDYDDIKKVYSIWICMDVPDYAAYTITGYKIIKEDLYGHNPKENRYDLMEAVMICLGKEEEVEKGNRLHGVLSTLLSDKLSPREKEKILEEEYEIETTVEMEGGMQQMCNLSERIEERGIKKGIEKGIEKGFEQGMEKGIKQGLEQGIEKGIKQGLEQGMEKGIKQGLEQGIEKGLEQGIEQGIEVGKFSTLASLVAKGLLEKEAAAAELGIPVEEFMKEMKRNS